MKTSKQGGFTFVEVLITSFLCVMLFIAAFEGMTFCKQSARATAALSGAEALAYDVLMDYFNRPLKWFTYKSSKYEPSSELDELFPGVDIELDEKIIKGYFPQGMEVDDVVCNVSIEKHCDPGIGGNPWHGWKISVNVQWRTPGVPGLITRSGRSGRWHRLPRPLTIKRTVLERFKPIGNHK